MPTGLEAVPARVASPAAPTRHAMATRGEEAPAAPDAPLDRRARVLRYREDKPASEADTIDDVRRLRRG